MDKSTRIAISLVVTVLFVGFRIAARSSRTSRSSLATTQQRALDRARLEEALGKQEETFRTVQLREAMRRGSSEAHCAAQPDGALMFEVQAQHPDSLMLRNLAWVDVLPAGATFPRSVKVAGLDVVVRKRAGRPEGFHPVCLDSDLALAQRVRLATRVTNTVSHSDGAMLIMSKDGTAAESLLATDLKDALGVKGDVVAFPGSDNLVGFAAASDLKAVRGAAIGAALLDHSGAGGCVGGEPLVLRGGTWSTWTPHAEVKREVDMYRRAAKACLRSMLQDQLAEFDEVHASPTERRFDLQVGSIVKVSLARSPREQLVLEADQVELAHDDGRRTVLSWPVFERVAKNGLLHLSFRKFRIDDAWSFDPAMVASLDTMSSEKLKSLK